MIFEASYSEVSGELSESIELDLFSSDFLGHFQVFLYDDFHFDGVLVVFDLCF